MYNPDGYTIWNKRQHSNTSNRWNISRYRNPQTLSSLDDPHKPSDSHPTVPPPSHSPSPSLETLPPTPTNPPHLPPPQPTPPPPHLHSQQPNPSPHTNHRHWAPSPTPVPRPRTPRLHATAPRLHSARPPSLHIAQLVVFAAEVIFAGREEGFELEDARAVAAGFGVVVYSSEGGGGGGGADGEGLGGGWGG